MEEKTTHAFAVFLWQFVPEWTRYGQVWVLYPQGIRNPEVNWMGHDR